MMADLEPCNDSGSAVAKNIDEMLPKSLTGKALGYLNNEWKI